MNFEKEVTDYLSEKGYVRREKLIEDLIEKHSGDRGYSKPTIDRKLNKMIESKIILNPNYDELGKYNIEETDKRASYLIFTDTLKLKKHLDEILELLKSEDDIDKRLALKEIEYYKKKYVLDGSQLDSIIQNLDGEDQELIYELLLIIFDHIVNKKIKPLNEPDLLIKLRFLLKQKFKVPPTHGSPKKYIIRLLGYYDDELVIEQLIKDAKTVKDLSSDRSCYTVNETSNVIEKHRTELFNLQRELAKEGKDEAVLFVSDIRRQAMKNLGILD
ncbi:hypothetical protein J7W08_04800 [Methanococcoides orientis]|uniref:hypothetical protein n=1 Tax=Methanococcoides orientis TaxID=2822137 RepID=UPI001E52A10B|nr:hypothetical protein [Methanococcoides orientis]UGV41608.1 hypothetical protein J7W08_04800 [Methanococcoides orientis]